MLSGDYCVSGFISNQEDHGQWLLDYGRKHPQHRRSIGEAASKLLHDPRIESFRESDSVHWLAILGDEFFSLSEEKLEAALVQLQGTSLGIATPSPLWGEGEGEGNRMRFQPPSPPSSPASGRGGQSDSQRG